MSFSRRQLLAGIAASGMSLRPGSAQYRAGDGPKTRTTPSVCLYSQVLIKAAYDELGPLLKSLGVDGCDLTVMPGGHVDPQNAGLHLMRAVEAITGVGLDVPVLSTNYTSLADRTLNTVAGVAHEMGVPLLRAGRWKYPAEGGVEARLAEVQRDLNGLAALARAAEMTVVLQNVPGEFGGALWDSYVLLRGLDPRLIGYDYDAGNAVVAGGNGLGDGAGIGAASHPHGDGPGFLLEQRRRRLETNGMPAGRGHGGLAQAVRRPGAGEIHRTDLDAGGLPAEGRDERNSPRRRVSEEAGGGGVWINGALAGERARHWF